MIAAQMLVKARQWGLQPGDRLIEQRFATELGISRGPIRTGLKHLETLGHVSGVPNKGYVLTDAAFVGSPDSRFDNLAVIDGVYRAIAEDRLDDKLPQIVSEAELIRRYSVTRPEILRTLDRIAAEGWVERSPGYGWRFIDGLSSPAAYAQSLEFRRVVEPNALLQPDYHLPKDVIASLRKQQERVQADTHHTLSIAEVFEMGSHFHEEIARGTSNPFFVEAIKRVNSIRRLFAYRLLEKELDLAAHTKEHLDLLDLIEAGELKKASKMLADHLGKSTAYN